MSGGAAALLVERCANRSNKNQKDVVSMTLSYSKAVSDPAVITVQGKKNALVSLPAHLRLLHCSPPHATGQDSVGSAFGTVVISRKGKLCTSANLAWGNL